MKYLKQTIPSLLLLNLIFSVIFSNKNYADNKILLEISDSPGVTKTTLLDNPDCIMAFNQAYGADAREGLNTVNGKRIYLGVGTAVNQFKIPLKHSDSQQGRWVNALRKSQLLAEIRAKQSYALNKKSTIERDITNETLMQIAVDPSKGYFMNEDEISALDELKHFFSRQLSESHKDDKKAYSKDEREAAVKTLISQEKFQDVIKIAAYADMNGIQTIYTNYHKKTNEFCVVVTRTNDSHLMARGLRKNQSNLLKPDSSKASDPIIDQLKDESELLHFTHGLRILRDENGELELVAYVIEPYEFSADKKVMGNNDYNAMRKAERRAKSLINNFINESIYTQSIDSMTEITTTYNDEADNGIKVSDYYSESFTESRLKYESSGYVMGFKKIKSKNAINSISGEPIHIYIGSISAKHLREALILKSKRLQR